MKNQIVSFDDEKLILVDEKDNVCGYQDKLDCHMGEGQLHRAFSVLIFNKNKELLIQKRSQNKILWPGYWSNTCCSHPRKNETYSQATFRRLKEELGFSTPIQYLYQFKYHARFFDIGSESELCSVYIGRYDGPVEVNEQEIEEYKFISLNELESDINGRSDHSDQYTPWFKTEWQQIKSHYSSQLNKLWD